MPDTLRKRMLQIEKDRSDKLLLNILPEEVAQELKAKGKAEAKLFDEVSILFTDFAQFTRVSEQLTPRELVTEIHECFEVFDHIIQKYNLEKIKTVGDTYMAASGIPETGKSSTADIVSAALEMQEFIIQRFEERNEHKLPAFTMRAGIHTGPVVAGIVGVKKFQYDIWGDTVNIASRMESSGDIGRVNISQATYELIKEEKRFDFENRGKIAAKGKGEMNMFFVNRSFSAG